MMRLIILSIMLLSGVGTIPALIIIIMMDIQAKEEQKREQR